MPVTLPIFLPFRKSNNFIILNYFLVCRKLFCLTFCRFYWPMRRSPACGQDPKTRFEQQRRVDARKWEILKKIGFEHAPAIGAVMDDNDGLRELSSLLVDEVSDRFAPTPVALEAERGQRADA